MRRTRVPSLRATARRAPRAAADAASVAQLSLFVFPEVVVIDTETTGLGPSARVVEVAAVHAVGGAVVREFHALVNPGFAIPRAATAVHGITDAMVRGAPPIAEVWPAFLAFCGPRPLVAHNAAYDRGVLANELRRLGAPSPALEVYCTCRLARRAFPEAPNHKLGTLAAHLGLRARPTHRATADAHTALGVLHACLARTGRTLAELHGPAARL